MDPLLAKALKHYRDRYDYPWAVLRISTSGPLAIGSGLYVQYDDRAPKVTDISLDHHQYSLLTAPPSHSLDLWAGCGSAIYWGFRTYGPTDRFARTRADRFFTDAACTSASAAAAAVAQASIHCRAHQWGQALGAVGTVRGLGQLPFGSKVMAFLDLNNTGVYDNRINGFLAATRLDRAVLGCDAVPVDRRGTMIYARVSSKKNQLVYQRWCERLRELRDELNRMGPACGWRCTETATKPQKWRAVDVERAIFRLTKFLPPRPGALRTGRRQLTGPPSRKSRGDEAPSVPQEPEDEFDPADVATRLKEHCERRPIA